MRNLLIAMLIGGSVLSAAAQSVPLAEALDSPDLTWKTNQGHVRFEGSLVEGRIGGDAATATISNGQSAEISTLLSGPGIIDFWIHDGNFANWTAIIDNTTLDLSSRSWPFGFRVEGEGLHLFKLTYKSTRSSPETVSIDAAIFRPDKEVPLGEALDHSDLTWTTSGDKPWVGTPYFAHDEIDAARCGSLALGESSILETNIEGPAEVRFHSRLPYSSGTRITFSIDGVTASLPTHRDWKQHTLTIGPGNHTLRWEALQEWGPSEDHPGRALWLDQFSVTSIEEGFLSQFATPEPGTNFRGNLFKASPGFMDESALGLKISYCRNNPLFWPLPPSDNPRRILFHVKNGGGSVRALGNRVSFGTGDAWIPVSIIASPETKGLKIYAGHSDLANPALIDDLYIEEIPTLPITEVLGPIASQFTSEGWHGWPVSPETPTPAIVSTSFGSRFSGTINGPAWMSYDIFAPDNDLITLTLDGKAVQTSAHSEEKNYRFFIPSGEHEVSFVHLNVSAITTLENPEAFASIRNLKLEPLATIPINNGEFSFEASGLTRTAGSNEFNPITWPAFIKTPEAKYLGLAAPGQQLSLSTQITGPALLSFERHYTHHRENQPYFYTEISCTTGTIFTTIGSGPWNPGTSLSLDGVNIQSAGRTGAIGWLDGPSTLPTEPLDPENPRFAASPVRPSSVIPIRFHHESPGSEEGWKKFTLYLGPGTHELKWNVGTALNDVYGEYAQWSMLKLANFKLSPVLPSYHSWASQQWIASPDTFRPDVNILPWQHPFADPDQDGNNNATEFAFGSDPRSALSQPHHTIYRKWGSPGILWGPTSHGITWKTYFSTDLQTWSETGASTYMTPDGLTSQANESSTRGYFRIEPSVTIPSE